MGQSNKSRDLVTQSNAAAPTLPKSDRSVYFNAVHILDNAGNQKLGSNKHNIFWTRVRDTANLNHLPFTYSHNMGDLVFWPIISLFLRYH